ncbi:MAG: FAD-dependent monooxygenase [Gemmatimonadota bacterium]
MTRVEDTRDAVKHPERAADAVVVGAGPAGSVTALLLARQGLRVILVDRQAFPRDKPCGECLSARATRVLDRLGLLDAVEAAQPARLHGWTIHAPGGARFTGRFGDDGPALAIERLRLDTLLLDAACAAGAQFFRGHVTGLLRPGDAGAAANVVGRGSGSLDGGPARAAGVHGPVTGVAGRDAHGRPFRLYARLVVGADGLRSVVARRLGMVRRAPRLRKVSLTTHIDAPGLFPPDTDWLGEMHLGDGACVGLAPIDATGRRVNLTLVVAGRPAALREERPEAFVADWIRRMPALCDRLGACDGNGVHVEGPFLASGPFDVPLRAVVADGAMLVGDAAGYYDPFTGQGIYRALASAESLAGIAGRALRLGDTSARRLAPYGRQLNRMVAPGRRLQHVVEWALARPRRADRVVRRLARSPDVADALIAVTGDTRPVRTLLTPGPLARFLFTMP